MVTRTLDAMADGGINDQLGGGFARYSTDAHWLVPHFEKMLYDNALLAHAYLEAFRATGNDRYARVARATLDFMLAELRTDDGGFASALDADSEGVEGRFYAWSARRAHGRPLRCGPRRRRAAMRWPRHWGVTAAGNWEGTNVLHRRRDADRRRRARRARPVGAAARPRSRAIRPARDDKQLAAWNGLALRALAPRARSSCGDAALPRRDAAARRASSRRQLVRDGDRLWRTARDGRGAHARVREDYLAVADGLLDAHAALGDAGAAPLAARLVETAIRDFWDDDAGTFVDTSPSTSGPSRGRAASSTTPRRRPTALGADVLQRLALLTGDEDLERRARSILRAVAPALERQPSAFGRMLCAADRAARRADRRRRCRATERQLMRSRCARRPSAPYAPDLVLTLGRAGDAHAELAAVRGQGGRDGRATAYACRGYACDEPTTDPARLASRSPRWQLSRPSSWKSVI